MINYLLAAYHLFGAELLVVLDTASKWRIQELEEGSFVLIRFVTLPTFLGNLQEVTIMPLLEEYTLDPCI